MRGKIIYEGKYVDQIFMYKKLGKSDNVQVLLNKTIILLAFTK